MAVMLPFAQLWGPTGTIMTMLGQVLPGIHLYLLLIAGLLTFFYLRRIKDPESDLKDIFSFVLVIGGISLLVFGNLMVLILVIGMFAGGYLMIHHWMKQSEHTPAEARSRVQQQFPREYANFEAEAHAAEGEARAAHSPEEREFAREAHDMVTLKEELAAAQAALADAANKSEALSQAAVSANEREEALLQSVEQTARELKEKIEQKTNLTAADEAGRQQIIALVSRMKTVCQKLAEEDLKLSNTRDEIATGLFKDIAETRQMAERAEKLVNIVKAVLKHLNKNIGTTAINAVRKEFAEYKELLAAIKKQAKKVDPKDKAAIDSINKQLADCQEQIKQVEALQAQVQATKKGLDKMVDDTRKEFDETCQALKQLKDACPPTITENLIKSREDHDKHHEALKKSTEQLAQKMTALESSGLRAEMLAVEASSALSEFFVPYLGLRESASKLTQTIKKSLDSALLALQQETVTFSHVDTGTKLIEQITQASIALTESASKFLKQPIDEANVKKAEEAFAQLDLTEEQERRTLVEQTSNSIQKAIKDIEAFITQDTRSVDAAKTHRTNLLHELSNVQEHIIKNKTEIIQDAKKQLVGAQKQMEETVASAQQRRAA